MSPPRRDLCEDCDAPERVAVVETRLDAETTSLARVADRLDQMLSFVEQARGQMTVIRWLVSAALAIGLVQLAAQHVFPILVPPGRAQPAQQAR